MRYRPLCLLLAITSAVELVAEWFTYINVDFTWIYHLFVMVEYTFVSLYFMRVVGKPYRNFILYSIPLFAMLSACISYWMYDFRSFPGMNINTEGFLVCIVSSYTLLNLPDVNRYERVTKHPDFWISFGWMIFFTGTFFSNGLYSYLQGLDRSQALALFGWVNKPLNIVLYSCLIIGFLCALLQRSTLRSY